METRILIYNKTNKYLNRIIMKTKQVIEQSESDKVFEVAEKMPSFPGGQYALFDFIEELIKYPKGA